MQERKSWFSGLTRVIGRVFLFCFSVYALYWILIVVATLSPAPISDFPLIASFGLVKFGEDILIDYMEKHGSAPEDSSWSNYYQTIIDLDGTGREKRASALNLEEKYIAALIVEYYPVSDDIYITYRRKTKSNIVLNGGYRRVNSYIAESENSANFIAEFKNSFYYIEKHGEYIYLGMTIHFTEYDFSRMSRFLRHLSRRVSRNSDCGEFLFDSYRKMTPNGQVLRIATISRKVKIPDKILGRASSP